MSTMPTAEECTVRPAHQLDVPAGLIDVRAVATLLGGCSTRHVHRLSDAGRMPAPIKLGNLVRWRRAELDEWIRAGCPSVRTPSRTPA